MRYIQCIGRTIHQHRLGNVVCIVAGDDVVHTERRRAAVERLAPEHAAERAVVLPADACDDIVHRPAVQVLVPKHGEREPVLLLVPLHRLEAVVAVSGDALVNTQQKQVDPIVVALIERLEHVG